MALELERPEWHARAACLPYQELYWPPLNEDGTVTYSPFAVKMIGDICEDCPVWAQCGALGVGEEYGVWAGDIRGMG